MKPLNEDQVMNSLNERDGVLVLIGTIKVAALAVLIFAIASILLGALLSSCEHATAQPRPDRDALFAAASTEATRYALDRTTAERNQAADISTINQIITTLQNESSKIDLYNSRRPVYRFGCYARQLRKSQLSACGAGRTGNRYHYAHRP